MWVTPVSMELTEMKRQAVNKKIVLAHRSADRPVSPGFSVRRSSCLAPGLMRWPRSSEWVRNVACDYEASAGIEGASGAPGLESRKGADSQ